MIDRLDDVTIGEPCKVDGCSTVCVEGEDRCHDHSVNRMIEGLFAPGENCHFGGIDCTIQATHSNPHDVPMCETCYNVWVRISRGSGGGGMSQSQGPELLPPNHRWPQRPRHVTGNQQSMGSTYEGRTIGRLAGSHDQLIREATAPPVLPLVSASTYDGGSYHRNINWRRWMERAQREEVQEEISALRGEEDCTCNNLDHSQFNEECPLNEDPPHFLGHLIGSGAIRTALGIPPIRRDEGEETE